MTITCPHCHQKADADEIYAGQEVECPYCGKKFVYGQNASRIHVPRTPGPRQTPESAAQAKIDISRTEASFCFWLGYCLPMFGILVAAVCYRAKGVANAIVGLAILFAVYLVGMFGIWLTYLAGLTRICGDIYSFTSAAPLVIFCILYGLATLVAFVIGVCHIVDSGKALDQSNQS